MFYALDMGGTNFRVVTVTLSKRANRVVSVLILQLLTCFALRSACNSRVWMPSDVCAQAILVACRGMWT